MTELAGLNGYYDTIKEMARSHFRAIFCAGRRAAAHLLEASKKHPHFKWQAAGAVMLTVVGVQLFVATAPAANASGESYNWKTKQQIEVTPSGSIGENPNGRYWYLNREGTSDRYSGTVRLAGATCNVKITLTSSSDHKTGQVVAVQGDTNPCGSAYLKLFDTDVTIGVVGPVWGYAPDAGCPGSSDPTAPPTANYNCPDGGRIVNGKFYPDNNSGRIDGIVTRKDDTKKPSIDACRSATVNVTRVSGAPTGDVTVKTTSSGTFALRLGPGEVILTTPDCKDKEGNVYSGSSRKLTVVKLKSTDGPYQVTTLVAAAKSTDICDQAEFGELNYFLCPIVHGMGEIAEKMDNGVLSLIKINTDNIFNDSGTARAGNAYFLAWAAFRNIAYAILVIFALVMIGSQILGMDFVDAYTFRKLLPRLVIAVILIAFSWNGLDFIFNLSNDAADAGRAVIAAPFNNIPVTIGNTPVNAITLAALVPLLLTVGTAGFASIALLGFGGIAALLATAVLAVFSAWVLLVGRDVIAGLLVMTSPLAIIFWAFGR